MAEIVNLNRHRKARARQQDRAQADANAALFGRTRTQKQLDIARAEKSARDLDAHHREPGQSDTDP